CFSVGGPSGGFNCEHASFDGRRIFAQSNGVRIGADDTNAYALDACTGELVWASSSIGGGQFDGALANGMYFQMSNTKLQVVKADDGAVLATVPLEQGPTGGGGVNVLPDGRILVPSNGGVALVEVVSGSNASPPMTTGSNMFAGPYRIPVSPEIPDNVGLPFVATQTDLEREYYLELDRNRKDR
ncbi:MAG: hypothetical protein ACREQ9_06975, partial [Candidatus Binatia bacterium]